MSAKSRKRAFLVFVLLVCLAGFTPFLIQGWRDVRAFRVYEQGTCTVVSQGFYVTLGNKPKGSTSPAPQRRHPELMYRVHAAGATYFAYGFDNMKGRLATMSDAGEFQIGKTYPCWYDPANPEQAILVRKFQPKYYAAAAIPAFMASIIAMILVTQRRRALH